MEEKTNFQNLINKCLISLNFKKSIKNDKLSSIRNDILLNLNPKNYSTDSNFRLNLASKKTSNLLNEIENLYSQGVGEKNIFKKDPKTKNEINNFYDSLKINMSFSPLKNIYSPQTNLNRNNDNDSSRKKNFRSNSSLMLNSNNYGNNFYNIKNKNNINISNYNLSYKENKIKNSLNKLKNNTLLNNLNNNLSQSQNSIDKNNYNKKLYKSNSNVNLFKTQLSFLLKKDFGKNYKNENFINNQNNNDINQNKIFQKIKKLENNYINNNDNYTKSNFLNYNNNTLKDFNYKKVNSKTIYENNRDFENFNIKLTDRENFNQHLYNFKKKLDLIGTH